MTGPDLKDDCSAAGRMHQVQGMGKVVMANAQDLGVLPSV